MIVWIELIIVIEFVLNTIKIELLMSLGAWGSIFSDWRFLVLAPSILLNQVSFIIFVELLVNNAT